jgi:carbon monoxide dehydrogenase subunit G
LASIIKEVQIDVRPEKAWAAIRDFGNVQRLVPGFLINCRLDGEARIVTFASGRVAREELVSIDDELRRLVYAEPKGVFLTRNASLRVFPDGDSKCRVTWIIDVLPDGFADLMRENMDRAMAIMKRTLEAQ